VNYPVWQLGFPGGLLIAAVQLAEKWGVSHALSYRELFFRAPSRPDFVFSGRFFDW